MQGLRFGLRVLVLIRLAGIAELCMCVYVYLEGFWGAPYSYFEPSMALMY